MLRAQEPAPPASGSLVRVKATGPGQPWVAGELEVLSADSVRLRTRGPAGSTAFATDRLVGFEVSRGRHARTGHGALLGAGIGAVLGLVVGLAIYEECSVDLCFPDPNRAGTGAIVAGLGGVLGAGVGAGIGSTTRTERWEAVPWPSSGRGALSPTVRLGLRASF